MATVSIAILDFSKFLHFSPPPLKFFFEKCEIGIFHVGGNIWRKELAYGVRYGILWNISRFVAWFFAILYDIFGILYDFFFE